MSIDAPQRGAELRRDRSGEPDQRPGGTDRRRTLEPVLKLLIGGDPLHVPRIELAQITRGPLLAEVVAGAIDDPVELGQDLLPGRVVGAAAQELLEQPWI